MIPLDRVHGGNPADGVLDFSASINPLGLPPTARDAYHAAVAKIARYPQAYPRRLEAELAAWLEVRPDCVIAGNGSTQLIYLLARVFRPRVPLVVTPTFSEIANGLIIAGSEPRALTTTAAQDFRLDPDAAVNGLRDGADAIFLGRPNSPTGTMLTISEAAAIADECELRDAWCVFDEAFIDFVQGAASCVSFIEKRRKTIVLRSFTKIFSIPGLRVGCLVAHPDAVAKLRSAIEPWSVNAVADAVTRACLRVVGEFIEKTRGFVGSERTRVIDALSRLAGIRVFPSVANFLMVEIAGEPLPGAFSQHMLQHGIAVRDLHTLSGCYPGLYRIAIKAPAENDRLLQAARIWAR